MRVSDTAAFLTLRGGFMVRTEVHAWLVEASWRLTFQIIGGELDVYPLEGITADDRAFITSRRDEIVAAVAYCESPHFGMGAA